MLSQLPTWTFWKAPCYKAIGQRPLLNWRVGVLWAELYPSTSLMLKLTLQCACVWSMEVINVKWGHKGRDRFFTTAPPGKQNCNWPFVARSGLKPATFGSKVRTPYPLGHTATRAAEPYSNKISV